MKAWHCTFVVIVACGGKSAAPTEISNTGEPAAADNGVREPSAADCLDEQATLAALAPGWEELDEWTTPQVDHCVRGRFPDEGVLVYASSQPAADSQTEMGWPARRVVFGLDGNVRSEGPADGGSYMSSPASPIGAVDLDGDGSDEVLEGVGLDFVIGGMNVLGMVNGELVEIGTYVTEIEEEGYVCKATWTIGDRALVLEVVEEGDRQVSEYSPPEFTCLDPGTHNLTIGPDGMLVDGFAYEE